MCKARIVGVQSAASCSFVFAQGAAVTLVCFDTMGLCVNGKIPNLTAQDIYEHHHYISQHHYRYMLAYCDNKGVMLPLWAHGTQGHAGTSEQPIKTSFHKMKHWMINLLNQNFEIVIQDTFC